MRDTDAVEGPATSRIRLQPDDELNRALVREVHPPDWRNPEPRERYHLVVVGAGTGGLVSAAIAAGLGARVALVERHLMGGDCLNVGCVPSKGIIRAARSWHEARTSLARFGGPRAVGPGDFAAAMERMRRIRAAIAPVDGAARFAGLGVDVFLGEGRFSSPESVEVDGRTLRFRRAVIATGARAAMLPVPGLEEVGVLTNETVFSLTELPERLIVVGAGPIGAELAQAFARFGSKVTVVHADPHPLPAEDEDAARIVQRSLERDGVTVLNGASLQEAGLEDGEKVLRVSHGDGERRLAGDQILLAAGRTPNVENLGLEAAGVEHGRGGIRVDDRLRTTARGIYAVGDVCSPYQFTHAADHMARIAVQNALFFGRKKTSDLVMPWVTYTSPEVAHVGLYEEEARAMGHDVETITIPMEDVDRARLEGDDDGFLRLHLRKGSDRILGATLVAENAGDLIGEITLAMTAGVGLGAVGGTIHPYPTRGDVFPRAANAWRKQKLTPTLQKVFSIFFRIFR